MLAAIQFLLPLYVIIFFAMKYLMWDYNFGSGAERRYQQYLKSHNFNIPLQEEYERRVSEDDDFARELGYEDCIDLHCKLSNGYYKFRASYWNTSIRRTTLRDEAFRHEAVFELVKKLMEDAGYEYLRRLNDWHWENVICVQKPTPFCVPYKKDEPKYYL